MDYFANSREHLLAELQRIDLLIRAQVACARKLQADDEQFRGLYISEEEVDALLQQPLGRPYWWSPGEIPAGPLEAILAQLEQQLSRRKQQSLSRGIELRLERLQQLFQLDSFEIDVLLIALGVEIDLRYERLYAYLQDDINKKKPSVDLVLNLLTPSVECRVPRRRYFSPQAPLFQYGLLEFSPDPSQPDPPLLAKYLKVDPRIAEYLFGHDELDERLRLYVEPIKPCEPTEVRAAALPDSDSRDRLSRFIQNMPPSERLVIHLQGPYGVGKQGIAETVCREQGLRLLVVELARLATQGGSSYEKTLTLINREARLQAAALYWQGFDTLGEPHQALVNAWQRSLQDRPGLTFLAGETPWKPIATLRKAAFISVPLLRPSATERAGLWRATLDGDDALAELELGALATKFKFTAGQIQDAAVTADNLARWREPDSAQIRLQDLYEACRLHSNQTLATLARKITPKYRWTDIVLPPDRLAQLREICNHMKYRERVYGDWGFDAKLALGKGLSVLFAGPSGTGKTMAAEIIAGELGLDLYKIDLSTVVSKYIGETEKNLSRIFAEAETSNAILFFDEADALFGKRSEVKDAHDRYANIETGYLLQRMEEYEGVVILATNFRKNMDEAFVRRLQFTVEFPFPSEQDRYRIWEGIWPADTPRDPALDLAFMARRFEVTGGNIRNIALAAAFLAADDGGRVAMGQLLRATQREYQKMGKVITETEFGKATQSSLKPLTPLTTR
jgi:MoxR-like ATPase